MTDKTTFWNYVGQGIAFFLIIMGICLGIGGCNYLVAKGIAIRNQSTHEFEPIKKMKSYIMVK